MTRTKSILAAAVVSVAALLAGLLAATPAQAAEKLPVPYTFIPSALFGGMPGANAAGTNDFACRPTKRKPRPVILIHGLSGNRATNWPTYGPLLKNSGYCVFALTYGVNADVPPLSLLGGFRNMKDSAEELRKFVNRVLKATGASKVDLVGHSEGTVMPHWYLRKLGGHKVVYNFVGIAPVSQGTKLASFGDLLFGLLPEDDVPICTACAQLSASSAYIRAINKGGIKMPGVRYTNIATKYDQLVLPYTQGFFPGARNIVVQDVCGNDFSEHFEVVSSRNVARLVQNTLDPLRNQSFKCATVLPFVGP